VNNRDSDSVGARWRFHPEHAAPHEGARTARVVLIEPRTLFRECLAYALTSFLPYVSIEGVKSANEVAPGPANLLLIGPNLLSGCEPWRLRGILQTLRRLSDGSPIGAYLHVHDNGAAASLIALGVVGIVKPDDALEIAVANIRLMLAGGTILTPGLADHRVEIDSVVPPPAVDLSTNEVTPQAHAHPNELLSPYRSLTARERDVFKRMSAGSANKRIALDLQISEGTVKVHLHNIMKKLHATNRTCAFAAETAHS
jgi:two-component system nitrate/nitrite response regulator NarL